MLNEEKNDEASVSSWRSESDYFDICDEYQNGRSTGSRPWAESKGWIEKEIVIQSSTLVFWKQMKLNCGAERHHYSMLTVRLWRVRRWTFDVGRSSFKTTLYSRNVTSEHLQNSLSLMGFISAPTAFSLTLGPLIMGLWTRSYFKNSRLRSRARRRSDLKAERTR